jgi:ATP-dependent DNA ligase
MAREDLHFRLRIPEELKQKVERAADQSHRSMTAEIVARLESSFEQPNHDEVEALKRALEHSERLRELEGRVLDAVSQQNDALTKAALLSERVVLEFARAFWMNASGDSSELDRLIKNAKENPASMAKLMSVASIKGDHFA